jgi:ankyrin repeat protein
LLCLGASVRSRNALGQTALHIAAEFSSKALCALLIEYKADVEAIDDAGMSVLFYAILSTRSVVVSFICDEIQKVITKEKKISCRFS